MVVTRKTSLTTVPPVSSRTNSSQPIPRAAKGQAPQTVSNPEQTNPLVNGESQASPRHDPAVGGGQNQSGSAKNSKSKKRKGYRSRKNKSGFLDLLTRAFILFFVIYTLSVCPDDASTEISICQGLALYRRLILEPYIFPPIRTALAHPSIAPYVERIQPHINRVITTTTPIILRVQAEWSARVVPQWKKHVVPQWNKRVVPPWRKYALPRIQHAEKKYIRPSRVRVQGVYNSRVATHIKVAIYNIKRWQRISQPYIVLAADKAYGGYRTTKHYVIPLWAKTKVTIRYMLVLARAQRRQFVDPHVARIWEKVKELSRGKAKVYTMPSAEIIMPSSVATSVPESLETVDSHSVAPSSAVSGLTAESAQSNAPTVFESPVSVEELDSVVKPTPPSSTVDGGTPPINISEGTSVAETKTYTIDATESLHGASLVITETLQSVSSVIAASAHETAAATSSVISSLTDEVHSRFSSVIASGREPFATPVPSARGDEDVNIDLNSFYAELGLHDLDDGTDSVVLTTPPVSHESETEEEKGERLRLKAEQTAKKRADIIARHVQWEEQLGALINDKQKELRKALVVVRKSAVTELKESADMRARVEGFVNEAEKFLKGAEVYLKNLEKELRKVEEKMSLWQRVVGKVETKFSEKLRDVENFVNGWYMGIIDREMQAVQNALAPVRQLAEKAQADLGLDYAWLDDVTYQDWQRYHALVGQSESFVDQANGIQNGSHPSPPTNIIVPALADLQSEVQDIVVGFETRLRRIKRTGERAFGAVDSGESLDIDENQPETQAPILPVLVDSRRAQEDAELDVPLVIIGRSEQEVLQAMRRAEFQGGAETSKPGSREGPREVEGSLP